MNNYYRPPKNLDHDRVNSSRSAADQTVESLAGLPLEQKKAAIRQIFIEIGVAVEENDNDAFGDGDQAPFETIEERDLARHLFAMGGDIYEHFQQPGAISNFAGACSTGNLKSVKAMIKNALAETHQPYSKSEAISQLLEQRETSMRLSPLLMTVAMGKNFAFSNPHATFQHHEVVKLILRHGASPVAKDITGKTVIHYGCGGMATSTTISIAELCIQAARSHHLFGKDVVLHSLNSAEMNGKVGIAQGIDVEKGRRSVYIPCDDREVWVKIENMNLVDPGSTTPYPLLVDVQDRLGSVALHELVMSRNFTGVDRPPGFAEQSETAAFLLKHNASIHIEEADGVSPFRMASGFGQLMGEDGVPALIMKHAKEMARDATRARRIDARCCWKCNEELQKDAPQCSKCKTARYCNKDCQVSCCSTDTHASIPWLICSPHLRLHIGGRGTKRNAKN